MLTTGRFLICLIVLVCLFVIAWNMDIDIQRLIQGDSTEGQLAHNDSSGLLDSNSGYAVSGEQRPDTGSVWQKRAGSSVAPQDFSSIAISDSQSNHFSNLSRDPNRRSQPGTRSTGEPARLPADTFAPIGSSPNSSSPNASSTRFDSVPIDRQWEQEMRQNGNNAKRQPRPFDTESQLSFSSVDPPPLVGDMIADGNSGQIQHAPNKLDPTIPDLNQRVVADGISSNQAIDQESPPMTLRSVDRSQNGPLVGNNGLNNDLPDPDNSPPVGQQRHLGQKESLVAVNKPAGLTDTRKPIGFVKHTWKDDDSLPELALSYLGRRDRFMEIVRLNASVLKDPNQIRPGTVLRIPVY